MDYTFNKGTVCLYSEPDCDSEHIDEAFFGQKCDIIEEAGDFYKVHTCYNYKGFVKKDSITAEKYEPNMIVVSPTADLLREPRQHFETSMMLPKGARVIANVSEERYATVTLPDGRVLYVHKNNVAPFELKKSIDNKEQLREKLKETALSFLGTQYRWGGKTCMGIDCSGLAFMTYYMNGYYIYRDANVQMSDMLKEIELSDIGGGDLLFFKGHVAVYLGGGKFVHSTSSFGGVCINSLSPFSSLYKKELAEGILCVATIKTDCNE